MGSPGLFESFYAGVLQQPVSLWVVNLLGTIVALRWIRSREPGPGGLRRFVIFWALVSVLDAWLTANEVLGLGVLPSRWSSGFSLVFVVLGDLRVFWAIEKWGSGSSARRWTKVLGLSLVVPILMRLSGADQKDPRILFLVYELCFMAWVAAYVRGPLRKKGAPTEEAFARSLLGYVLIYYGLWAAADIWILAAAPGLKDAGFALRVIPNWLYYGTWGFAVVRAALPRASSRE